jgi:hypothetical protein
MFVMFRALAAIAFAMTIDLYLFDGKYDRALQQVAVSIAQRFWH